MRNVVDFLTFLNRSPTVFHAAREVTNRLAEADFTPLNEKEKWTLERGGSFFVTRGDALVAAFRLPKKVAKRVVILASHLDSPGFKLKPHPDGHASSSSFFITESYGAPILHTWMDRDLKLAGKLVLRDKKKKRFEVLVELDDAPLTMPSLSLHLDRTVMEKGPLLNKQDHMRPVFALGEKKSSLLEWVKKHYSAEEILSSDLFLAPMEKAALLGENGALTASYRLDNLTSAYAALDAILSAKGLEDQICLAFFWDHEEIGSKTALGADSLFALELLQRISHFYGMGPEEFYPMKNRSLCLSVDVTHGSHPNYPEKYDAVNAPYLGKGPAVKFSAAQKYATLSSGAGFFIDLAKKKKLPIQDFASRSDIASGSTVGPFMAAQLGMTTVDLGISCWGMHSIRETVSTEDEMVLCDLLRSALETPFTED